MRIVASLFVLLVGITSMASAAVAAPEIDPGSVVSAVALAGSMLLMVRGRKR